MNYNETITYLYSQLPVYQRIGKAAYKDNLDNTHALDKHLNSPHQNYPTIHVAGTNGKGSVSHMIAAILQKAGFKTGLYTSPHLLDFRERIKVNGKPVSKEFVVAFIHAIRGKIEELQPSFFELTVAMAFQYFKEEEVDYAVIEVGMGGRLDSTNIIKPLLSVITNIGMDHTAYLGNTIEKIAIEKAGIIKEGTPVIIGRTQTETHPVFSSFAAKNETTLIYANEKFSISDSMIEQEGKQVFDIVQGEKVVFSNLKTDLIGRYQKENIITAILAISQLSERGIKIPISCLYGGLENTAKLTGLRGRWEILEKKPLTITDMAHNADGLQQVFSQLAASRYNKLHVVFGMVNDKDAGKALEILPRDAIYYFTRAGIPRALDEMTLANLAREKGLQGQAYSTVKGAFLSAKENAGEEDVLFIGGSTFVVAEVLALK